MRLWMRWTVWRRRGSSKPARTGILSCANPKLGVSWPTVRRLYREPGWAGLAGFGHGTGQRTLMGCRARIVGQARVVRLVRTMCLDRMDYPEQKGCPDRMDYPDRTACVARTRCSAPTAYPDPLRRPT